MTSTWPPELPLLFPPDPWIPNEYQVEESGIVLLAVAGQSLDHFPINDSENTRGDIYERRVLTTGTEVPMLPDLPAQLAVSCLGLYPGRAGEQRFQFFKGTMGFPTEQYARFSVQLARKAATPTGGIAPKMASPEAMIGRAGALWTDTVIVRSALIALVLGGIKNAATGAQVSAAPITQDNILIGPVEFQNPRGSLAIASIEVQIQY